MNKSDAIIIIRSLLSSIGSPCSTSDLNKEFRNETGMDIPLFGYNTISDFLLSIPHVVKLTGIYPIEQVSLVTNEKSAHIVSLVKRQKSGKQKKKFSSFKYPPKITRILPRCPEVQECHKIIKNGNLNGDEELDKKEPSLMSFTEVYFKNWCTDEEVSLINLKLHGSVGDYVEVWPCEILSPDKFFFHLRIFKKKFISFMNNLQSYYAAHEEIPCISVSLINPRQICAVFHEAKWFRAEIQEVIDNFRVIVKFIDFGSTVKILKHDLKFLHKDFISLPRQACAGSLANIRPLKFASKWSPHAVKRFHDLAFKKNLVAGIVNMDTQACCMSVALTRTKGQEIHINDTLVKEGYAEFEKVVLDSQSVDISEEENVTSKPKFNFDKIQLIIEKECSNKKHIENSSISMHAENHISPEIDVPAFYAQNVYNSNFRLKKMFSAA